MAQHTPGPWYRSTSGRYIRYDMPPMTGANVCDLDVFGGPPDEAEANARLIAAAPDLLAACKLVVACYKGTTAHEQVPAWEAVLAAIAKAEGRS